MADDICGCEYHLDDHRWVIGMSHSDELQGTDSKHAWGKCSICDCNAYKKK